MSSTATADACGTTGPERVRLRRYLRDLMLALAAYAVVLVASRLVLKGGIDDRILRVVVSLAPMLPILFAAAVIIRHINALDEMQRRIQVEALALSFVGTAVLTMGWGFLENVGAPRFPVMFVWPLMGALWIAALLVVTRRYAA